MAFALLFVGVVFLVSAASGTQGQLFALLKSDFSGPNNYFYWLAAILVVGVFGYIPRLKPISDMFLVLIVLSLVLTRGNAGLFQKASAALTLTNKQAPATTTTQSPASTTTSTGTSQLQDMVNALTSQSPLTKGIQ